MSKQNLLSPVEIAEKTAQNSENKVKITAGKLVVLGILAGAFIAFAGAASNMGAFNLLANPQTFGLGKILSGAMFSVGLMLVVLCGAELFTGNSLMLVGVLSRRISVLAMLKNWIIVYVSNLLGGVLVAFMICQSGQLSGGANLLGAMTIKIAVSKVSLTAVQAILLGIMCNWLVCLAVWMATAATDVSGKILAIFFPIWLFVTAGFEHSVANMFYIPAGIFAKSVPEYANAALELGVTAEQMGNLNWGTMLANNLLPVTIGNIIGGGVFVAAAYYFVYLRKSQAQRTGEEVLTK